MDGLRHLTHLLPGEPEKAAQHGCLDPCIRTPAYVRGGPFDAGCSVWEGKALIRGQVKMVDVRKSLPTNLTHLHKDRASDLAPIHPFIRGYKHDGQFSISEPYPTRSDHELPPQSVRSKYFRVYHRLEDKATGISYTEKGNPLQQKQARKAQSSLGQKHSVPPIPPQRCKQACSKREKSPRQNPWVVTSSLVRELCFCRFVVSKRGGAGATVGRSETSSVYAARSVPGSCRIRGWPTGWIRLYQGRKSYWYTRPPTNPCKSPP